MAVRHRAIVAETTGGSVACFPPPHQFFFPRDLTDNLKTVWYGRDHRGLDARFGFGIRQAETRRRQLRPLVQRPARAPSSGSGSSTCSRRGTGRGGAQRDARYTHGDRFPDLPGYVTFTSHWHMAIAVAAMKEKASGKGRTTPDFVRMFKDMGVNIVHLAEFHGDGHPSDPGPLRLPEMKAMFDECRRLSDDELLFLPGEEANVYLGLPGPGPAARPLAVPLPQAGLLDDEARRRASRSSRTTRRLRHGLPRRRPRRHAPAARAASTAWPGRPTRGSRRRTGRPTSSATRTSSAPTTGSAPPGRRCPPTCPHDRLGRRALDLLDDMANWGQQKYVPGEVDVFKIDHTHELYGHMNINYLRLDRSRASTRAGSRCSTPCARAVLRHDRRGPDPRVHGRRPGERGRLASSSPERCARVDAAAALDLPDAVRRGGLGRREKVYRERIDLAETGAVRGRRCSTSALNLTGRSWVRLEAWDVAGNGAFTQPVWLWEADERKASREEDRPDPRIGLTTAGSRSETPRAVSGLAGWVQCCEPGRTSEIERGSGMHDRRLTETGRPATGRRVGRVRGSRAGGW